MQTKTAPITNYLEESYNSGSSIPNIPSDEIDSNLAKFAATIVPESIEEEPKEVVEEPTTQTQNKTSKGILTKSLLTLIIVLCLCAIIDNLVKDGLNTWVPSILKEIDKLLKKCTT